MNRLNNLLCGAMDYAQVRADSAITGQTDSASLTMLDIDNEGLDEMDNRILEGIIQNYNGGPFGIKTTSVTVSEDEATIEEVYETFLIQEGYLMRTPQGRVATNKAREKLGLPPVHNRKAKSDSGQPELFQ